ncbi:hypothetical protein BpHYR1_046578 [Brachionus plicatilis]|uniref:Uncharacterized protein n=1 Tax=Brachionus plicatilis TaxID=10195 RepID=A0A3M7Q909_BRAPC|nr:hypothetical protein BpHYR1_046578 [Brachionus plicatilis]
MIDLEKWTLKHFLDKEKGADKTGEVKLVYLPSKNTINILDNSVFDECSNKSQKSSGKSTVRIVLIKEFDVPF